MSAGRGAKPEEVYQELRRRITEGRYPPGTRLVMEQLAREFGVSTIPVREAGRRLEAEGFLVHTRHVGFEVVALDDRAYGETLETLAVLEAFVVATAAETIRPWDLEAARDIARGMTEAVEGGDLVGFGRLDRAFHRTVCLPCPNAYALDLVNRAYDRLDAIEPSVFTRIPKRARPALQEHFHLLETLAERAPASVVERLVREHHRATLEAFAAARREARR
ncbi:MAG: GntR family transcriptional regulator [Actinomycetia bacterium]|nr:GntR family transcriptional regulator [Actinomycetes bacterium]